MKIVADRNIPFFEGVFEPYAEVIYKEGQDISADDVKDADALVVNKADVTACKIFFNIIYVLSSSFLGGIPGEKGSLRSVSRVSSHCDKTDF